jgi:recombination protein RecR
MAGAEIDQLIARLAKLPGLGPRSARRAALVLLKRREALMTPLIEALRTAAENVTNCTECGNLDSLSPCAVCRDESRERGIICVVEDVGDLWALERPGSFRGLYHVLGGTLSALDGVGPEDLNVGGLLRRAQDPDVREIIIALSTTVDGQITAHYLADRLAECDVTLTRLAQGVPMGGELDYLDDGTLEAALKARRPA